MKSSKTFRLFISSTFNDFREERKVLQTKVFPAIKEYCSEKGYRFQPIDLRWGINNEAQLDQKTLELCLNEVKTCKSYPHPNFLVMLGDRYGWIPLPYMIEQDEFDEIKKLTSKKEKALLNEWYQLDENQLPASYILKHREGKFEKNEVWNTVEKELLKILQLNATKANLTVEQLQKYFTSATEAEIIEGVIPYLKPTKHQKKLLDNNLTSVKEDTEFIFGFFRNIRARSKRSEIFITDDFQKAQRLKTEVKEVLLKENVFECTTKQINEKDLDYSYLETFEKRIISFLKQKLDIQIKKETFYTELEIEKQEQDFFAKEKRKNFIGQETALKAIDDYIKNDNQQPFILYGKSGSGKSSIMAKAIENAKENSKSHILYRFVGATSNSSSSIEILTSIFSELDINIEIVKNETFEQFSERIKNKFLEIKTDTIVFIDAVDQLTNNDYFLWLPHILPKNLKIIISALDDKNYETDSIYFKTLKQITSNIFQVKQFNKPQELILSLLEKDNRTLQKHQLEYFLKQYKNSPTPLYIFVAYQEIKYWKSFDLTEGQTPLKNYKIQKIANSQKGIIEEFITNLSEIFHHDKNFVQKVLVYIYASKDGLSENEILELLNTDNTFIEKLAPETWHKNITNELPLVIWTRLYTQLKPFLSKKNQDNEELLYFFHREFKSVITDFTFLKSEVGKLVSAIMQKIKIYQFKDFYQNRWGILYSIILYFYFENYGIRKNSKFYTFFLKIEEKYTETFIQFILNKWDLYTNSNSIYLKIAYFVSAILYKQDSKKWAKAYAFSINDLAFYHSQINNFKVTLELEKEALKIREKRYNNFHEWEDEYVTSLLNISNTFSSLNDINSAIYYSEKALTITKNNFKKAPLIWLENYVINLNHLASYFKKINKLSKALPYSIKAYKIISKYYKINPDLWAELYFTTIRDLADLFYMDNQLKKAEKLNIEGLSIVEKLFKKNNKKWAHHYIIGLNQLAVTYHELNYISKSIAFETKAFNLVSHYFKEDKDYWMVSYLQVANNLNYNNPNIDVLKIFKKTNIICKKLYQKLPERWMEYYFANLNNLAYYYLDHGIELKKTIKLFKEAIEIIEPEFNKNPNNWIEQYLSALNNLASYYLEISETKKAVEISEKAFKLIVKFYKKEPNRWNKDYILYLSNLSYAYAENGQNKKAIQLEKKNYTLLQKLYTSRKQFWKLDYIKSLNNLAVLLKENNQVQQAIVLEKESLKIIKSSYKKDATSWGKELVYALNNLSFSFELIHAYKKAKYYYKQELALIEKLRQKNKSILIKEYTIALNNYADLFHNPKKQFLYYKKSFDIIRKKYKKEPANWREEYVSSLRNIATLYKQLGNIEKALSLEKESLKIVKKLFKLNKDKWVREYVLCLDNLGYTYHLTNEYKKAIKYENIAITILEPYFIKNSNFWIDDFVVSNNNLGVSYRELKQYEAAEKKLLFALRIIENVYKDNKDLHRDNYQLVLDNLLILYRMMGDRNKETIIEKKNCKTRKILKNTSQNK